MTNETHNFLPQATETLESILGEAEFTTLGTLLSTFKQTTSVEYQNVDSSGQSFVITDIDGVKTEVNIKYAMGITGRCVIELVTIVRGIES